MSAKNKIVECGDWMLEMHVDDDNHLTVNIYNKDGSEVIQQDADLSEFVDGREWCERFTTSAIEAEYQKTL